MLRFSALPGMAASARVGVLEVCRASTPVDPPPVVAARVRLPVFQSYPGGVAACGESAPAVSGRPDGPPRTRRVRRPDRS